ncbi:MAG: hypothetical protein DIU71_16100 [Proteobacteria bacterium]|nr:MAG: hypothetical protein DIU71_16100 [Pseudomonadota bacterium]
MNQNPIGVRLAEPAQALFATPAAAPVANDAGVPALTAGFASALRVAVQDVVDAEQLEPEGDSAADAEVSHLPLPWASPEPPTGAVHVPVNLSLDAQVTAPVDVPAHAGDTHALQVAVAEAAADVARPAPAAPAHAPRPDAPPLPTGLDRGAFAGVASVAHDPGLPRVADGAPSTMLQAGAGWVTPALGSDPTGAASGTAALAPLATNVPGELRTRAFDAPLPQAQVVPSQIVGATLATTLADPSTSPATAQAQEHTAAQRPLAQALGERLHVQIGQRSEQAIIRLDPPSMGSIEVLVRHEGGMVQVQLRAGNAEVVRQLHAITEALRQDLTQRQHAEVSVQIADTSRDGDGRQRQRQPAPWQDEPPGRGLDDSGAHATFALAQD